MKSSKRATEVETEGEDTPEIANVYVDHDDAGRPRWVKSFPNADPAPEFDLLCTLDHLALPRVLDCGITRERFWFAQDFVDGQTLEDRGLSLRQERDIAAGAAHALLYLHRCGLAHGDIHPGNVLVARTGFPSRLVDLGLAGTPGVVRTTRRRGFVAPEDLTAGKTTPEGDAWSLAATFRASGIGMSIPAARFIKGAWTPNPARRLEALRELADAFPLPHSIPRWKRPEPGVSDLLSRLRKPDANFAVLVHAPQGMGKTTLLDKLVLYGRSRGWHVLKWDATGGVDGLATAAVRALRPLLILVDGADAGGARIADSVRHLAEWAVSCKNGPIGLIAAASRRCEWPGEQIPLEPVPQQELWSLVHQVTGMNQEDIEHSGILEQCPNRSPAEAVRAAQALVSTRGIRLRLDRWRIEPYAVRIFKRKRCNLPGGMDKFLKPQLLAIAAASLGGGFLDASGVARAAQVEPDALTRLVNRSILDTRGGRLYPVDPLLGRDAVDEIAPARRARLQRRAVLLARAAGADPDFVARGFLAAGDLRRGPALALKVFDQHCRRGSSTRADALMDFAETHVPPTHPLRWKIEFFRARAAAAERADDILARQAEAKARGAEVDAVKEAWASLAHWVWSRLGREVERERLAAEYSGLAGFHRRAVLVRARRMVKSGDLDAAEVLVQELPASDPERTMSAGLISWQRGHLRPAIRRFLASARAFRDANSMAGGLDSIANLTALLELTGRRKWSQAILETQEARIRMEGSDAELLQILVPVAGARAAAGRIAFAQSAMEECERLTELVALAAPQRSGFGGLPALLLRFAGKPAEALERAKVASQHSDRATRGWVSVPTVLALLDLGRYREAATTAKSEGLSMRSLGDRAGEGWMSVLRAEAEFRRTGSFSEALPQVSDAEVLLRGWSEFVAMEIDLAAGRTPDPEPRLAILESLPRYHAMLGTEALARAALLLGRAGLRRSARRLLQSAVAVPESPIIEVLLSAARAAAELTVKGALRLLHEGAPFLARAGAWERVQWLELGIAAAQELKDAKLEKGWARTLAREKEVLEMPDTPELKDLWNTDLQAADPSGLAHQTRQIKDIVRQINEELNVDRVLDRVLESALSISGAQRGLIVLVEGDAPVFRAGRTSDGKALTSADDYSRTISREVLESGRAFESGDAANDDRLSASRSLKRLNTKSVLCLPFRLVGRTIGTFYLDHADRPDVFDATAVDALQTLADLASVAIRNASLFEKTEAARKSLEKEAGALKKRLEEVVADTAEAGLRHAYPQIVGRGPAMMRALREVDRAADLDLPVLIEGESGVGKELFARAVHTSSDRATHPFVAENCAAISAGLIESELFGHVKGAFSGATTDHEGLFRRAKGGTLFLDEIGELPKELQAKLLRVIEEGEIRPVGSDKVIKVKCRVVVATNRTLSVLVEAGHFRQDLYYRLAALRIVVPPLRARVADIPDLVKRFLSRLDVSIEPDALRLLMEAEWPGNVRHLKNDLAVLGATCGSELTAGMVQAHLDKARSRDAGQFKDGLEASVSHFREMRVRAALAASGGEVARAAQKLQITYQGLRRLVRLYRLEWRSRGGVSQSR